MMRMAHRSGLLQIGDCALYAEVCSPHRAEAFAACADLVESVKASLPVWKLFEVPVRRAPLIEL